ncbi:MAG TPA: nucleotidyltransferase domain-containing protein [Candidatus Acidoferrum sp.]|nr:nucleotidyltransferase domain-containing protein [Candidatus Acidoferrum sp.]
MFGLTPAEYDYIRAEVVAPLHAQGGRVFCYGSRARGDHKRYSDLDLMVEADKDLSALVSLLQEHLSNGPFPYKVELVELRDFAAAYKPGYERDKKPYSP